MQVVQVLALLLTALSGTMVVLLRRPGRQAIMVSAYGLVLACLFFAYQAPDVALSVLTVGAIILPLLLLLTLAKVRHGEP
jgi:energy-converting hydrogenase B subunit D